MKIINKVIVFVMGIVVLGVVSSLVFNMSQETEKAVVTFEILENDGLSPGTYDSLFNYLGTTDNDGIPLTFEYNGELYNGRYSNFNNIMTIHFQVDVGDYFFISDDDTWLQEDPQDIIIETGDKFILLETAPPQLTGVTSTLIILIPLILSASLIGFLAFKKGDE